MCHGRNCASEEENLVMHAHTQHPKHTNAHAAAGSARARGLSERGTKQKTHEYTRRQEAREPEALEREGKNKQKNTNTRDGRKRESPRPLASSIPLRVINPPTTRDPSTLLVLFFF
jgi:hypothetical protein